MVPLKRVHAGLLAFLVPALLYIALVTPNRLSWVSPQSFTVLPVELLMVGFLLLIPGRVGLALRWAISILLAAGVIFKIADMATYQVFARPFNPIFDAYLLVNGMGLLSSTLGQFAAVGIGLLLVIVVASIASLAFLILAYLRRRLARRPRVSFVCLAISGCLWVSLWLIDSPRAATQFIDQLALHLRATHHSIRDRKDFAHMLANQTESIPDTGLFELLKGKDVLIIFIESYGRTVFDKPEFAQHIRPLAQRHSETLRQAGIEVRSSWLTSPTVGGLSWLAHATAMSGLWVDSQIRYDTLVTSEHPSLNKLFSAAGWRSVGVMPAITMAWPEGNYFGYDHLYHAHNSGYNGKPFNWVTMPDQFTLAALQKHELERSDRVPIMAEVALISSHAPWTPVPTLVAWDQIGDGKIFDTQATAGESPEVVWSDPERIRLQFRLSVEYVLHSLVDYLVNYGTDNMVVLAFGDHQPAPLVTENSDNRDVPVHLFTRDKKLLDAIAGWNWAEGMVPADAGPVWGMDEIRGRFIRTFSTTPQAQQK